MTIKNDNIKLAGYRGTWYIIDSTIRYGIKYYLLESEQYGDETCALVINQYGKVITETYDDLDTALDDELGI